MDLIADVPTLVPLIDEAVPLPANAAEALPNLSREQEIEMRARTIKLISDLTGRAIIPTQENVAEAEELARQMIDDPKKRIEYSKYPNETMAYLAGLIQQSNCALVDELSELKNYVINKLIYEVEHSNNSKERISALTKLGEVDGVDAFKKRSEVTVQVKPIEEVEKELMSVLEGIEYRVVGEKSAATDA
jgi:vacuolar-type H+-ATPase subunit I/STV1